MVIRSGTAGWLEFIHLMRIGAANRILIAFGVDTVSACQFTEWRTCTAALELAYRRRRHGVSSAAAARRPASVETYCTRGGQIARSSFHHRPLIAADDLWSAEYRTVAGGK